MIRVLSPQIVNQIAAGEVIERPFSVVKELVENSLDAGATRITVELSDGGTTMIRVTDDGAGFTAADLELAFASHATSKLSELADLDHIASLGFRGEALASIGAVSRAHIKSRRADAESGYEVRCDDAGIGEVKPCACPPGSIIEIRDLFHNTPARRRFLKTPRAERAKCQDLLVRLSLVRLDVDFTFAVDDRQVLRLPAGEALADRVARTFGQQIRRSLLGVHHVIGEYRVEGLVADPDAARRDSTRELLYINGRSARDRGALFAVRQAYRDYLMHGRYPVYFLNLWLPPAEVDVNVHPTKAEVRFVNQRLASGILHDAVKQALAGGDIRSASLAVGDLPRARSGLPDLPRDLFGRSSAPSPGGSPAPSGSRSRPDAKAPHTYPGGGGSGAGSSDAVREAPPDPNPFARLRERSFLQAHDLYLVFAGDDGLVVVDQHALHERVLYERFKARHEQRELQVQRLLVPEVLELSAEDKEWLLASAEALAGEGFVIADFGGNSIAIQGIPAVLDRAEPRTLIETFLAGDGDARPAARDAIVERFHSMACRAAVMSGDRLSEEEIRALLFEAQSLEHPHNCPHGRPTVLTFTSGELERFFRRRV